MTIIITNRGGFQKNNDANKNAVQLESSALTLTTRIFPDLKTKIALVVEAVEAGVAEAYKIMRTRANPVELRASAQMKRLSNAKRRK